MKLGKIPQQTLRFPEGMVIYGAFSATTNLWMSLNRHNNLIWD